MGSTRVHCTHYAIEMNAQKLFGYMLSRMSHKCQINIDYAQPNKLISVYTMSNNHGRPFLAFIIDEKNGSTIESNTLQCQYQTPDLSFNSSFHHLPLGKNEQTEEVHVQTNVYYTVEKKPMNEKQR